MDDNTRMIVKDTIGGVAFEILQLGRGMLKYSIGPDDAKAGLREVGREDFMALAAFMRAMAADQIAHDIGPNADHGVAEKLHLIAEALDPDVEDTLAHRLVAALNGVWNCMPG